MLQTDKMAKRPRKTQRSQAKLKGFVTIAVVEDLEQAKNYEVLLKTDDIPAVIKRQDKSRLTKIESFFIMVPENFIDEAYAIIESQNAYDDFYDFALENKYNDDNDDLDSEFVEDDF